LLMLLPHPWTGGTAAGPGAAGAGTDPFAASLASLALALGGGPASRRPSPPDRPGVEPGRQLASEAAAWRRLAGQLALPQLLMLAIGEEWRPLLASLRSLNLIDSSGAALQTARPKSWSRRPPGPSQAEPVREPRPQLPGLPAPGLPSPGLPSPGPAAPC
jgi:hypothetical protein